MTSDQPSTESGHLIWRAQRSPIAIVALLAAALLVIGCGSTTDEPTAGSPSGVGIEGTTSTAGPPAPDTTAATPSSTSPPSTASEEPVDQSQNPLDAPGPTLTGRTILVDPGHNGANFRHATEINRQVDVGTHSKECDTTGTASPDGVSESSFNWDVSSRLIPLLEERGATVELTRDDDDGWGPCIDERAAIGNRAGADLAISIHADGGPEHGRGFHVIYPPAIPGFTDGIAEDSLAYAVILRDTYRDHVGFPVADYLGNDGLDARSDLGGLNLSGVPKVFLEAGNMRNAEDWARLSADDTRQHIAEALVLSIERYFEGR